ncbi:MAG: LysR substrate-binding domain-containing protein [Oscillospiraceae bacterium]|jgi:DNA-binding transcriptional LysR family regulator
MEFNQLKYFLEVAEREHITQAAAALHITQPALSKTLARFENEIGVKLFDREGKTIRLNNYGKTVKAYAERILNEIDDMLRNIDDLESGETGQIIIGSSIPMREPDWVINSIRTFTLKHPRVNIIHYQMKPAKLKESLEQREIDIAIGGPDLNSSDVSWTKLYTERLGIIISKKHPFAEKKEISVNDLVDEKFLCNNASSDALDITHSICARAGFTPNIYFESYYSHIIGEMISLGRGVSIIAEGQFYDQISNAAYDWEKNITFRRLKEDYCERVCGVGISKNVYLAKPARELYNIIVTNAGK